MIDLCDNNCENDKKTYRYVDTYLLPSRSNFHIAPSVCGDKAKRGTCLSENANAIWKIRSDSTTND